jgi:hypothetical protein
MSFSRASAFCLLLSVVWLSGCSHYRLGTGAAPTFHTLYVEPVANKTMVPQAREIVSTQLREAFARDGRVALVNSAAEAEASLTVVIADFRRDVAAAREGDTGLARKFDLTLGVDCTLRQRDGKVLFENRRINAQRESFTDSGQLLSEYQTMPLLAESLAAKITHAALDVW